MQFEPLSPNPCSDFAADAPFARYSLLNPLKQTGDYKPDQKFSSEYIGNGASAAKTEHRLGLSGSNCI